jgi:Agrobacterium tumefaciens protein Atu4866
LLIPTGEIYGAFSIHPTQQCVVALLAAARVTNAAYDPNFYVGMWVTQDGYIRHELRPGGHYDEARGNRKSAYQGNYILRGDHIDYLDDTGFTAGGEFKDGVLYHAGMVLFRENSPTVSTMSPPYRAVQVEERAAGSIGSKRSSAHHDLRAF